MNLPTHIISTHGKRLHSVTITTPSAGLDRPTIHRAEQTAKAWARENGHKVVSDIVAQGEYRAWVDPIPPGRIRAMQQLGRAA